MDGPLILQVDKVTDLMNNAGWCDIIVCARSRENLNFGRIMIFKKRCGKCTFEYEGFANLIAFCPCWNMMFVKIKSLALQAFLFYNVV